jgi:hypothetical protein
VSFSYNPVRGGFTVRKTGVFFLQPGNKNCAVFVTTPVETKVVVLSGRHGDLTIRPTCAIGEGMIEDIKTLFEKYEGSEYMRFDRVQNKTSNRSDLHAFNLLDKLAPVPYTSMQPPEPVVIAAGGDEIWLSIKPAAIAAVATEEHILELIRCGVLYDCKCESFSMLV